MNTVSALLMPIPFCRALIITTFCSLVACVLPACASDGDQGGPVTYSSTAKQNYDKGLAEMKDENYPEARKYLSFVKQKFPFSKFAVLAELALADALFKQESFQAAIDAYKAFVRLHPTHEQVENGYAAYRVCACYFAEMPEDWLILPPAAEKDQSAVRDALRELSDFIDKYPDSEFIAQAVKSRKEVLRRMVEHEVYVARFYLDHDHPKAAILRLEDAIKRFPESGREAELLLTLGQTHLQMGHNLSAKETFQKVTEGYRGEPQASRANLYLNFIAEHFGPSPKNAPIQSKTVGKLDDSEIPLE